MTAKAFRFAAQGTPHLAFAGLGAREAASEAFADNTASNKVSAALGYEPNGLPA